MEDSFQPDGWGEIKDVVTERFHSEKSSVIAARLDDFIVGFAIAWYIHRAESAFHPTQDFCNIDEFGVNQKFRHQGMSAFKFYEGVGFLTYRRDLELATSFYKKEPVYGKSFYRQVL